MPGILYGTSNHNIAAFASGYCLVNSATARISEQHQLGAEADDLACNHSLIMVLKVTGCHRATEVSACKMIVFTEWISSVYSILGSALGTYYVYH